MDPFVQPISELYRLTAEIEANLDFITQENRTLNRSSKLGDQVRSICEEFKDALYDVKKEIRVLEDKLGMHPGEEPFDPNVVNKDPKVTMRLIDSWLREAIEGMHSLIKTIEASDAATRSKLFILCAESGTNILNGYHAIKQNLGLIAQRLP